MPGETLTIRHVDRRLKEQLRIRAAQHGHSMAAELRQILGDTLEGAPVSEPNLAEAIGRRFAALGGVELEPPLPVGDRCAAVVRTVIVLDTNVLSELMRPEPHPAVFAWVAAQPRNSLYDQPEPRRDSVWHAALPAGRRQDAFTAAAELMFREDMAGRVLPFDGAGAVHYAKLVTARREAGAPIEAFDSLIVATALAAGAEIATRDVGGFAGCGLSVVNPWTAPL